MNDCDALLQAVLREAKALGIPVSQNIDPEVKRNRRAARRFGCCRFREGRFEIEVAQRLAEGPEAGCRETLAHGGAPHLLRLPQPRQALAELRGEDERRLRLHHLPHLHQ